MVEEDVGRLVRVGLGWSVVAGSSQPSDAGLKQGVVPRLSFVVGWRAVEAKAVILICAVVPLLWKLVDGLWVVGGCFGVGFFP